MRNNDFIITVIYLIAIFSSLIFIDQNYKHEQVTKGAEEMSIEETIKKNQEALEGLTRAIEQLEKTIAEVREITGRKLPMVEQQPEAEALPMSYAEENKQPQAQESTMTQVSVADVYAMANRLNIAYPQKAMKFITSTLRGSYKVEKITELNQEQLNEFFIMLDEWEVEQKVGGV